MKIGRRRLFELGGAALLTPLLKWIPREKPEDAGPWHGYVTHGAMWLAPSFTLGEIQTLTSSYAEKVLEFGPTAYWPLDGSGRAFRVGHWIDLPR